MVSFDNIINTQLLLLSLIAIGVITAKSKLVDKQGAATLSELVLNVLLPCNILSSFINNEGKDIFRSLALMLIISVFIQAAAFVLGKYVFYRAMPPEQKNVLCYSTLISNASFLGNPVVESIFGLSALVYASVYLLPLRVSMWTLGMSLFTGGGKGNIKKIALHPCMIATYLGVILLLTGWNPPPVINRIVFSVGNCLTAISMIVVGNILAQVSLRKIITKTVLYFSFIRLLLLPAALIGILFLLRTDPLIAGVSVALTGMPAPATASILASKYGGDSELASRLTLVSVLLSMLTVPAMVMLIGYLFK
ncbi:transporter [Spirochaetia bacterium]|nr:transporter [Spirochaetia bacterium]